MKLPLQTTQVTLEELRTNLAELAGQVMYSKKRITVTKYNRQALVILNPEEYQALLDPTQRLSRTAWDAHVAELEAIRQQLPEANPQETEKVVIKEIKALRNKRTKA